MSQAITKRFDGVLPEESFAIVQEMADQMGMSVRSFVSMATIRYALQLKREFNNTVSSNTTVLSREGAEHFTELLDNADRIFGKKQEEFRVLASKIDIKDTSCQQSDH